MAASQLKERVEREDMVMFVNACFACTRQQEFYSDQQGMAVTIEFLHSYIRGNYRRLYARTLAAGINHFNQAMIIVNLLADGSPASEIQREEEGRLISIALKKLPTNRAFRIMKALRERRVNNRRTRAVVRRYLTERKDPVFDAVKYRSKFRAAAAHAHLRLEDELSAFLFDPRSKKKFENELFESFRLAHYDKRKIYDLPFTIAEGLASRHKVPRAEFLEKIEAKMTVAEKLRLQGASQRDGDEQIEVDLSRVPLTRLALYILSLPKETRIERYSELDRAMQRSAEVTLRRAPARLGKVAAVLDSSYSSSGSQVKRRRPLGVALAASYLLRAASSDYRAFWVPAPESELELSTCARGQTSLGDGLLAALDWKPDIVIIVSDGHENDPPCGAAEVARVFRKRLDPRGTVEIVHMNPVFDAQNYAPRVIGQAIPTVGLRDAEDIPTMLGFARFASGAAPLSELEDYLARRVVDLSRSNSK